MGVVAARCTQCGANIEVDQTKEAGICKYCGTAFITEKAISNYNTYVTNNNNFEGANINITGGDIKNLLEIAQSSLKGGNGKEAFEYSNKALEIKIDSSEAWLVKMRALEYVGTVGDPRITEVITCGQNAIQYAEQNQKDNVENEVYTYYLNRARSLLLLASERIRDVEQLKQTFQAMSVASALTAAQKTSQLDSEAINIIEGLATNALLLKVTVPEDAIKINRDYQQIVVDIANEYVIYTKGLIERYRIYGSQLIDSAIDSRKTILEALKDGLDEEKKAKVSDTGMFNPPSQNGCYIATCIYGSYNCPQVWTLRRFRDDILDENWCGRLFIKCYYAVSPSLVRRFGNAKWFRVFWKSKLDKIVTRLNSEGIKDTQYNDKY